MLWIVICTTEITYYHIYISPTGKSQKSQLDSLPSNCFVDVVW